MRYVKNKKLQNISVALLLVAVCVFGLALSGCKKKNGIVELAEFQDTASFAVTDLLPYDQPQGMNGTRIASNCFKVVTGKDFNGDLQAYNLSVENFQNEKNLNIKYKMTEDRAFDGAIAPDEWLQLKNGEIVTMQTAAKLYYMNLLLISENVSDMNVTITFDIKLTIENRG